jgi:hypothetical protein
VVGGCGTHRIPEPGQHQGSNIGSLFLERLPNPAYRGGNLPGRRNGHQRERFLHGPQRWRLQVITFTPGNEEQTRKHSSLLHENSCVTRVSLVCGIDDRQGVCEIALLRVPGLMQGGQLREPAAPLDLGLGGWIKPIPGLQQIDDSADYLDLISRQPTIFVGHPEFAVVASDRISEDPAYIRWKRAAILDSHLHQSVEI